MVQFRVTKKFAKDCKINNLKNPEQESLIFDDWVIDVFRVVRKKVAIVSHVQTLLTFLIPYSHVGGARGVIDRVPILLQQFLLDHNFSEYIDEMEQVFKTPPRFCKTQNRHVLGHMNDFKRCVDVMTSISFDAIDWDEQMEKINNMPVNIKTMGFIFPGELMKKFIENAKKNS